MFHGLLALLTRALRLDSRQLRNHIFRLTFVTFIYICLLWATFQSSAFSAPGLNFFSQIAWLNALFITCAGIGFFSSAITEEKEEETLGLLQMAGLNHLGILLGKSTSRLIQVMLLLVVQFPFMLLSVTLGGVTTIQIVAAYVDLLAFTVLLANLALVCSVVFQRSGTAAACTTLFIVIYCFAWKIAELEHARLLGLAWTKSVWWQSAILTALEWIQESCVYTQLAKAMSSSFNEPVLTKQVISNCVLGVSCFGLAWLLFGPSINNAAPGGVTRGAIVKSTSRISFLSPGRCWQNPFVWKDFQFIGGGYSLWVGKLLVYIGLFAVMTAISLYSQNWLGLLFDDVAGVYAWCMLGFLVLEACVSASRIFHDEIRLQTMSSLLMLPRSIPYIGYSKAFGCLLGLTPALICLIAGTLLMPSVNALHYLQILIDPRLWATIMTFLIFLHLIALVSLFVRWGALPAAIFLMGPVFACCPVWHLLLISVTPGANNVTDAWGRLPATITVWILTGLVCFVFQMMIAARLQELGTK